jgi:hypothetical protein
MPDDDRQEPIRNVTDNGEDAGYAPPELSVYEGEVRVAWAYDRAGESPPDDTLGDASGSGEAPKVLGWTAPRPEYAIGEPVVFAAPADPARKVSPAKKDYPKTTEKGKTTRTRATKVKLTGHDAFGGDLCTCDLVCTCNLVCSCQAVAACSCVEHTAPGGGCNCVEYTCPCVGDTCPSDTCDCVNVCAVDGCLAD